MPSAHSHSRKSKLNSWRFLIAASIPFLLITFSFLQFNSKYNSDITFITKEFEGLHEVQSFYRMQVELERIRGLRYTYLVSKDSRFLVDIDKHSANLEQMIYSSLNEEHIHEFNLHKELTNWQNLVKQLEIEFQEANDPIKLFEQHTQVVTDISNLIILAADRSNLSLDGQLDTYYIMDMTVKRIPYLTELLARMRGLSSALAANRNQMAEMNLRHDLILFDDVLDTVALTIKKIANSFKGETKAKLLAFEKTNEELHVILRLTKKVANNQQVDQSATALFDLYSKSIDSIQLFHDVSIQVLGQLLNKRVARLKAEQTQGRVGYILALLATIIGFGLFYRSNRQTFKQVVESQKELQLSEAYQRSVIDSAADGIITITRKGIIESFNPAAEIIFGYLANEVIGKKIDMLMPEPYRSEHDGYMESYHSTGKKKIIGIGREVVGLRKDGEAFPLDLAVSEVLVPGRESTYTGIVRDITERKQVEKMKNEFVSTVSHELRTPLTSIRGSLDILLGGVGGELSPEAQEFLKIANNNTERLLLLINDILDIQKIESGKMAFHFGHVDIDAFLKRAIEDNEAYGTKHKVKFKIARNIEGNLFADFDRLMQVMSNLMSNAAKFSPEGDEVEISAVRNEGVIRIAVSDHGSGIPEAFREELFEKFTQADGADNRMKGGSGLGLAISKLIVEKHGGKIGFTSQEGLGTTMYFDLPELAANLNLVEGAIQNTNIDESANVLIIEDDNDVAALLQRMLAETGYNSDIAYNGREARRLLMEHKDKYKAITLDILLPDENGVELLTDLRKHEEYQDIPVIVVSCVANETRRSLGGGALDIVGWLPKPFDASELTRMVRRAAKPGELPSVLHVEDEQDIHHMVSTLLKGQCRLTWVSSVEAASETLLDSVYDLVLLDIGLPDGSGLDLIDLIEKRVVPPRVVIFSANDVAEEYANKVNAVLTKSNTSNDDLIKIITDSIQ